MGLTLEFYATAHGPLFDAVIDLDFDTIDSLNAPGRFADLSLHITPTDLDLLSFEVCKSLGNDPISLRDNLDTEGNYVDEPDRGAFIVLQSWIQLIASLDDHSIDAVVSAWCDEMSRVHNDPDISTTSEAVNAMKGLVETCQYALTANSEVVHVWFA